MEDAIEMNRETISVIIPVYNAEKYIGICLDSLKSQTYQALEIICIDDESTDHSQEIIKQYCGLDERIKYYRIKNAGVSNARNVGIEKSTGEYILFLDSDDWIDCETCEVAYNSLLSNNADVVMWPYIREYGNLSLKKDILSRDTVFEGDSLKKLHKSFIGYVEDGFFASDNMDALSTVWGKLYRRNIIEGIKFYDIKEIGSYEDGLYNMQVFGKAKKAVYINRYFSHYRKDNDSSLTSTYNSDLLIQRKKIYDQMLQYIQKGGFDKSYNSALKNRIVYEILYIGLNELKRKASLASHILQLKKVMSSEDYEDARKNFNYRKFQIHWRIFYRFAVHKNAVLLFVMLNVMQIIRNKRN